MSSIESLVKALPQDPDEIAKFLNQKGIKGQPRNPGSCPIATYLDRERDKSDTDQFCVIVGIYGCRSFEPTEEGIRGIWLKWDEYPAVAEFIERFDLGRYPYLAGNPDAKSN